MRWNLGYAAAAAVVGVSAWGLSAPAWAEDASDVDGSAYVEQSQELGNYNVAVSGGVGGFLGGLSNVTGVGPTWGVVANGDLTRAIGWELGYDGSRTPITDSRLGGNPAMWRNGVDAMAKVYVPGLEVLRPFAGVGIGESYVNANEDAEVLYDNDFITEVPLAAGVDLATNGGLHAGLRASYRLLAGEEFAQRAGDDNEGGMLTGELMIGGRF